MAALSQTAYTIAEVADLLDVSQQTVRRWIYSGQLPARRYGERVIRITRDDLEAFSQPVVGA